MHKHQMIIWFEDELFREVEAALNAAPIRVTRSAFIRYAVRRALDEIKSGKGPLFP